MPATPHSMGRVIVEMAILGHEISDELSAALPNEALVKNASIAVLAQLFVDGPHRPKDLLSATGLTRGGLSKVLDQFEEAGLAERFEDPSDPDRRSVYVRLLDEGSRLAELTVEIMGRRIGPFVESASRILSAG